jgi:hypothetical protein
MKNFILCLFGALAFSSCSTPDTTQRALCTCCSQQSAQLTLTANGLTIPISTSNYTLNQTYVPGVLHIMGEVHPGNIINTGIWASQLIYKCNGTIIYNVPYLANTPITAYNHDLNLQDLLILNPGANVITVEAKCLQTGVINLIRSWTITLVQQQGSVTLTTKCCTTNSRNNGAMQLSMVGTVTNGNAFLKIEKPAGASWVQVNPLVPFVNGQSTPCYVKSNTPFFGSSQTYRAQLVDAVGMPIPNTGTTFPMTFINCSTCCPIPPR